MSVQYDAAGRSVEDASNVAVTTGAGGLGGTIGVRVIVDDAVLTSKEQALLAMESVQKAIIKQTWPAA